MVDGLAGDPFEATPKPPPPLSPLQEAIKALERGERWAAERERMEAASYLDQTGIREEQLRHNRLERARTVMIMTSGLEFEHNRQRNCAEAEAEANRRFRIEVTHLESSELPYRIGPGVEGQ